MENNNALLEAIATLTESVNSLTAIQTDIFNQDTSTDDIISLKGRMSELIKSNAELKESVGHLNYAINELKDKIKKR